MKSLFVILFSFTVYAAEHPIQFTAEESVSHYLEKTNETSLMRDALYKWLKKDVCYKTKSDKDLSEMEFRLTYVDISCDPPSCRDQITLYVYDSQSRFYESIYVSLRVNDQYPETSRVDKIMAGDDLNSPACRLELP